MCLRHNCCCIYDHFNNHYENEKIAIGHVICIHILTILFGRLIYTCFYNEDLTEYWCIWYIFLGKACIGLALSILTVVLAALCLGFLYGLCCKEADEM